MTTQTDSGPGLTTSVKNAFLLGIRNSIKPALWQKLDPALAQLDDDRQTYPEFPETKTEYPFVRVMTNISQIQQNAVNRTIKTDNGELWQDGKASASCTIYVYALSAAQRNKLIDAYINIIMFSHLRPSSSVLMHYLHNANGAKIDIDTTSISLGSDTVAKGIVWDDKTYVYTNSVSFNAIVNFSARLDDEDIATIKDIEVQGEQEA